MGIRDSGSGRGRAGWRRFYLSMLMGSLLVPKGGQGQEAQRAVWIDTDPACGLGATHDVDDCWALLLALESEQIAIEGISTVFGNVPEERAYLVASDLLDRWVRTSPKEAPPLFRGETRPFGTSLPATSQGVDALARALEKEHLTIVALGPLTNVAILLQERPDLRGRIQSIVAVAGSSRGKRRFFFKRGGLLHFHDLNFLEDAPAFDAVVRSGVSLVLLPFEAAKQVPITSSDLHRLRMGGEMQEWLAQASQGWLDFWRKRLGEDGFFPFDSLAVARAIDSSLFSCHSVRVRVVLRNGWFRPRDELTLEGARGTETGTLFCPGVSPDLHHYLVAALSEESGLGGQ